MPRSRNLSERDDLKRLVWAATEWWAISTAPGAPPLREHPLVSSLLFHNIFGFHRELLTLNDNDIDTMTTPMFRPDGTFDGTRPMSIQDKNHLKIARAFYNFVCYQVGEDVDVLTLSRDQYDDFRLNEYDFSTPTKPWRTLVEEENKRKVGEWKRLVKPDTREFPEFKDYSFFTTWFEKVVSWLRQYGLEAHLLRNHIPSNPEVHSMQQQYLYNLMVNKCTEMNTRALLTQFKDSPDVPEIFFRMIKYYQETLGTTMRLQKMSTWLTGTRYRSANWRQGASHFVHHFMEMSRIYNKTAAEDDRFSDGQLVRMLNASMIGSAYEDVYTTHMTARQSAGVHDPITFVQYSDVLLQAITVKEESALDQRSTRTPRIANWTENEWEVHMLGYTQGPYEDSVPQEDYSINAHDLDFEFDPNDANSLALQEVHRAFQRRSGSSSPRRKAYLDFSTWNSLSDEEKKAWDTLSDDHKLAIKDFFQRPTRSQDSESTPSTSVNNTELQGSDSPQDEGENLQTQVTTYEINTGSLQHAVAGTTIGAPTAQADYVGVELETYAGVQNENPTTHVAPPTKDEPPTKDVPSTNGNVTQDSSVPPGQRAYAGPSYDIKNVLSVPTKNSKRVSFTEATKDAQMSLAHSTERSDFTPECYTTEIVYEVNVTEYDSDDDGQYESSFKKKEPDPYLESIIGLYTKSGRHEGTDVQQGTGMAAILPDRSAPALYKEAEDKDKYVQSFMSKTIPTRKESARVGVIEETLQGLTIGDTASVPPETMQGRYGKVQKPEKFKERLTSQREASNIVPTNVPFVSDEVVSKFLGSHTSNARYGPRDQNPSPSDKEKSPPTTKALIRRQEFDKSFDRFADQLMGAARKPPPKKGSKDRAPRQQATTNYPPLEYNTIKNRPDSSDGSNRAPDVARSSVTTQNVQNAHESPKNVSTEQHASQSSAGTTKQRQELSTEQQAHRPTTDDLRQFLSQGLMDSNGQPIDMAQLINELASTTGLRLVPDTTANHGTTTGNEDGNNTNIPSAANDDGSRGDSGNGQEGKAIGHQDEEQDSKPPAQPRNSAEPDPSSTNQNDCPSDSDEVSQYQITPASSEETNSSQPSQPRRSTASVFGNLENLTDELDQAFDNMQERALNEPQSESTSVASRPTNQQLVAASSESTDQGDQNEGEEPWQVPTARNTFRQNDGSGSPSSGTSQASNSGSSDSRPSNAASSQGGNGGRGGGSGRGRHGGRGNQNQSNKKKQKGRRRRSWVDVDHPQDFR